MKRLLGLALAAWLMPLLIGCASQDGGGQGMLGMAMQGSLAQPNLYGANAPAAPASGYGAAQATPASLFGAAARGDAATVDALLSQGVNVNSRNANGATALQLASAGGYLPVVQSLIANGADVNAADYNGMTPLNASSIAGYDDVSRALKAAGARGAPSAQQPAAGGGDDAWWKK